MPEPAGCFGKLPRHGDFVSFGLSRAFRTRWDTFLQGVVLAARERLGDRWAAAWNEAPVWHGILGADLADGAPATAVGIPSVDRVGRHFPFTIVGHARTGGIPLPDWALAAEALALSALARDPTIDDLRAALDRLGVPGLAPDAGALPPGLAIPGSQDWPAGLPRTLAGWPAADCLIWTRDTERAPPVILRGQGLPDAATAAALLVTGAQRVDRAVSERDDNVG